MEDKDIDKYFTKMFNSKPEAERKMIIPFRLQEQIAQLEREKLILKRNYNRNIKEINDHLKNIRKGLKEYYLSTIQ